MLIIHIFYFLILLLALLFFFMSSSHLHLHFAPRTPPKKTYVSLIIHEQWLPHGHGVRAAPELGATQDLERQGVGLHELSEKDRGE